MRGTGGAPAGFGARGLRRLFIRKTVQQIQSEYQSADLKRSLGAVNLVLLGIGCIIGAGIFVRTGSAAALHAGPAVVISFLIAGTICSFAGLCYAELASMLPVSGSAYTYTYATLGEFAAWIMGALLLLEYGLAASTVAVGWGEYLVSFLHDVGLDIPPEFAMAAGHVAALTDGSTVTGVINLPAISVSLAMMVLLVFGVSESATVNNIVVAIKLAVIIAFIAIGAFFINPSNWSPFIPEPTGEAGEFGWSGILRAATIVFFAYIGFEAVSTAGQEAKDPHRDLPIGIIGSLIICTILYIATSMVLTGLVPYPALNSGAPVADAVDTFGPGWTWFAMAIKLGALAGLTSVILVLMYAQTRIFYTMARDGLIPSPFGIVHPRLKTPWINTILTGVIVAVSAGVFDINTIGDLTSIGTLAAFAVVCVSVIWLRRTRPDLPRGFRVPFYPVTPILGVLSCGFLAVQVEPRVQIFFAGFLIAAVVIYFAYGWDHSRLARERRAVPPDTPDAEALATPGP